MNESLFNKLVEISWRRRLTPAEEQELQAWLAAHPGDAERWEAEAGLNVALDRLALVAPVAPSSNFTRQVLDLVALEQAAAEREQASSFSSLSLLSLFSWLDRVRRLLVIHQLRLAWGLAVVGVTMGLGYHQYREYSREQVARGVRSMSTFASVTEPEVLVEEDFEAIRQFSRVRPETNPTDEALFALLDGK